MHSKLPSSTTASGLAFSLLLALSSAHRSIALPSSSPSTTYNPPSPLPAIPLHAHERRLDTNEYVLRRDAGRLPAHFSPSTHLDHDHVHHDRRSSNPQGSTEASAANSALTPQENCSPYYLPEINAIASQFPPIWEPASIVAGDQEAMDAFAKVNASGLVPQNISVRGTQPASLSGTGLTDGYDSTADPDCWWTASHCTSPQPSTSLLDDIIACPEPGAYGYSFDDGPNCTHNSLYDAWAQAKQKASLMYIGSNVMDWPLEAQRGIVDGHHICVHITPTCWRPPYGDVDNRVRGIAQAMGLTNIMWNQDTNDWNLEPWGTIQPAAMSSTYASIAAQATQSMGLNGGTIVLEHELEDAAMNFSISEYTTIKAAWRHVVPVGVCMNWTRPYVEQSYVYPDFEQYIGGQVTASGLPGGDMSFAATPTVLFASSLASTSTSSAISTAASATHTLSGGIAIAHTSSSSSSSSSSSTASAKPTSKTSGSLPFAAPPSTIAVISVLLGASWAVAMTM